MINRNNYEEYFLLYVDDELNKIQQAAVENFVQQNPDVAGELEMLKQATLFDVDEIKFTAKDSLYKTEQGISLSNYEEYFLLAVDKELNATETAEVEKFILQHPQLQQEFSLLQQTVLQSEAVEFTNKSALYRTEKIRRVIPIAFIRMSVAAAFSALIATLWMFKNNNNTIQKNVSAVAVHQPNLQTSFKHNSLIKIDNTVTLKPLASFQTKKYSTDASPKNIVTKNKIAKRNASVTNRFFVKDIEPKSANENKLVVAEPSNTPDGKVHSTDNMIAINSTNNVNENAVYKTNTNPIFAQNENTSENKSIIQQTVYREVDNVEDNNTIYIGAAQMNKAKVKALLHKAINFFDRKNTRSASEKTVQIASFQIKK